MASSSRRSGKGRGAPVHQEKTVMQRPRGTRGRWNPAHVRKSKQASLLECDAGHPMASDGGLPCGSVVRSPPAEAGDTGLIPDPGGAHVLRGHQARITATAEPAPQAQRPCPRRLRFAAGTPSRERAPPAGSPALRSYRTACAAAKTQPQRNKTNK